MIVDIHPAFVIAFGLAIVFIGLICIVILCNIMNLVYDILAKTKESGASPAPEKTESSKSVAPTVQAPIAEIPNREEFIAAVSAAIAEEEGTSLAAIRILSVKPL